MSVLVRFACNDNDVESVIGLYEDSQSPAPPLCPAMTCAGIATSSDELTGTEDEDGTGIDTAVAASVSAGVAATAQKHSEFSVFSSFLCLFSLVE